MSTSTTSTEDPVDDLQQTELWLRLCTEEVATQIGRPLEELESLIQRIVSDLGVTTLAVLSDIPDHVLLRRNIPAAFSQFVRRQVDLKCVEDEGRCEIERFLWRHGFDADMTASEIRYLVKMIVEQNWMESLESLRSLPASQWSRLGIADNFLLRRLHKLLEKTATEDLLNHVTPMNLGDILKALGPRLGKSEFIMDQWARKLEDENITTLEQFHNLSDKDFLNLKLPLRLLLELDVYRQRKDDKDVQSLADVMPGRGHPENVPYEEPDSATLIMRVGRAYNHSIEEVKIVADVLVNQHWLASLSQLRSLQDSDWEEFYLSRKFVEHLRQGLVDPYLLGMNAVWYDPAPLDLFPCDVEFAVDQMFDEVKLDEKKDLARAFLRLTEILAMFPKDASKRAIRKSNPNFQKRAKRYDSVRLFLFSLGYADFGSHFLLPVLYMSRVDAAHCRLAAAANQAYTAKAAPPSLLGAENLFGSVLNLFS